MQCVRDTLHRAGIHHRRPAKKVIYNENQKTARLAFAREYRDLDFSKAIFSDEKSFKSCQLGRKNLWRPNGTRYEAINLIPNTESGRVVANMWGWMSAAGPGELVFIAERATGPIYREVLENTMLPTVRTVYPEQELPEFFFIQDNSPIHCSHIVSDWFAQHPEVKKLPWPSRSPDLNPIENLWGKMVQEWDKRDERTKAALVEHCHSVWESMRGRDLCQGLVGSMRRRCDAVIDAAGGPTKY